MGRASPIQGSFNAGEWSPLLHARSDLAKFGNATALLQNWLPTVQGPVQRRPGTKYVAEVKDSSKATRLVPFEFSTTQAYIIEFSDQFLRFYRDRGQIVSGTPYQIASPYLEADLFEIAYTQSADVLYLAHPSYAPRKLTRTGHTSWTLSTIDFQDGPYLPTNTTTTTLTPAASTGTGVTLTASAVTGINGDTGFQTTDVGRLVRIKNGGNWGWAKIASRSSTTVVTIDIEVAVGTSAVTDWRLGVWSDTTGYPATVAFFEDRLWWGGGVDYPQRLDGSRTGDYENFAPTETDGTVVDDNAVSYTLGSSQVNAIRWMVDVEKGMAVGTVGGEWILRPSSSSEALTPTNVKATRSTALGSAYIQPVRSTDAVLFVQRSGKKLRELAYVFERDGFSAPDLSLLSEHLFTSPLTQIALAREPQPILWCTRQDGLLLGLTYDREQDVVGWHRHVIGGYSDAGNTTAAKVESVAVIPTPDGTASELWMVVERYINGGTKRYVEYLTPTFEHETAQEDAFYVDSGLTYDSTATSSISGLDHLEGETVTVLSDGATHPDKTVASGAITLDRDGSVVHAGLAYNSDLQTLQLEAGASDGTAQGKRKRVNRVMVSVYRSLGLTMGPDASTLYLPGEMGRSASDALDTAVPLKTLTIEAPWDGGYDFDAQMYFRASAPLPVTITAVMPHVVTENRQ